MLTKVSPGIELDILIQVCEDHFRQRGYKAQRDEQLHPDVQWAAKIFATKARQKIALEVRFTPDLPEFLREAMRTARKLRPDVKFYCAAEGQTADDQKFQKLLKKIGLGLYRIHLQGVREVFPPQPVGDLLPRSIKLASGRTIRPLQTLEVNRPYDAYLKIGQIVGRAEKTVKVIDPYCTDSSLRYFLRARQTLSVQLITEFDGNRATEEGLFVNSARILKGQLPNFAARKCPRNLMHDRMILTEMETWGITPSVKDAGRKFGTLFLVMGASERRDFDKEFTRLWNRSTSLV